VQSHTNRGKTVDHVSSAPRSRHAVARLASEAGEGVISTAIAVLIMALIGAGMWVAFDQVFRDASGRVQDSVSEIG
jgi:hypothetical protein